VVLSLRTGWISCTSTMYFMCVPPKDAGIKASVRGGNPIADECAAEAAKRMICVWYVDSVLRFRRTE